MIFPTQELLQDQRPETRTAKREREPGESSSDNKTPKHQRPGQGEDAHERETALIMLSNDLLGAVARILPAAGLALPPRTRPCHPRGSHILQCTTAASAHREACSARAVRRTHRRCSSWLRTTGMNFFDEPDKKERRTCTANTKFLLSQKWYTVSFLVYYVG